MRKTFLLVIIISIAQMSFAQVVGGKQKKLENYYKNEQWEDCNFKADRMILQEKYANDAEVYLYLASSYSKIFLMGLKDTMLIYKVPQYVDAYKLALKYSVTAKKKDKKAKIYFPANNFMLEEIAITGIYYIDHYVSVNKLSKASSFMRKILKTYSDVNLYFMQGVLCSMTGDTATGNPIIRDVFKTMDTQRPTTVEKTEFIMIDAFDLYTSFLLKKDPPLTDSARSVITRALRYYPGDELLSYYLKLIENPELNIEKPANSKKLAQLKQIEVRMPGDPEEEDDDSEDDESEDDEKSGKKEDKKKNK
ncbi:MAG TPA: hypothetical protein PKN32_10550 [Bacteroidales bacterium]|nr:hypothetical protein [Bacteroidales bacterium]